MSFYETKMRWDWLSFSNQTAINIMVGAALTEFFALVRIMDAYDRGRTDVMA